MSRMIVSVLAALVGIGIVIGVGRSAPAAGPSQAVWQYQCILPPGAMRTEPSPPRTAHESAYHHNSGTHPSMQVLNHMGSQGWELVAIDPNNGHYCFKRPGQ